MASLGIAGVGTLFRRWDGANWVNISEIKNISGPSKSRTTIDVTSLSSTGGYKEFIAGLKDPGGVTLAMIFRRDTYEIMNDDFEDNTLQNYEIFLPDPEYTSFEFEGLVTELPLTIPTDEAITCDVVIKVSGEVTINSGSGSSA